MKGCCKVMEGKTIQHDIYIWCTCFLVYQQKHFHVHEHTKLQVGKAYFELVDYMEADQAFNLARQASPNSLEGMDIYSTVLYVSFITAEECLLTI